MASSNIEQRLAALETEVAELKRRLEPSPSPTDPWWRTVSGAFAGDPAFQEAMRLGRQWRDRENARGLTKQKKSRKKT
jgi:hypothetical protein